MGFFFGLGLHDVQQQVHNNQSAYYVSQKINELNPQDINESLFNAHLSTAGMPDPELMIRTSGEQRISNYLLWQLAYAELYFTPKLWPDFRKEDLLEAIYTYQQRERRFGKTGDQIVSEKKSKQ